MALNCKMFTKMYWKSVKWFTSLKGTLVCAMYTSMHLHARTCARTHAHTHTCAGNPLPPSHTHIYTKVNWFHKTYISFLNKRQPHKAANRSLKFVENLMCVCVWMAYTNNNYNKLIIYLTWKILATIQFQISRLPISYLQSKDWIFYFTSCLYVCETQTLTWQEEHKLGLLSTSY